MYSPSRSVGLRGLCCFDCTEARCDRSQWGPGHPQTSRGYPMTMALYRRSALLAKNKLIIDCLIVRPLFAIRISCRKSACTRIDRVGRYLLLVRAVTEVHQIHPSLPHIVVDLAMQCWLHLTTCPVSDPCAVRPGQGLIPESRQCITCRGRQPAQHLTLLSHRSPAPPFALAG